MLINKIEDALPPEILVILIGARTSIDDNARMEMPFDQLQDESNFTKCSPGLRAPSHKNRKLIEIEDSEDVIEYWKAVKEFAKDMFLSTLFPSMINQQYIDYY
uniref:Uncharacterized protein n=1 Tax=Caenorhabditis japonica TaxID=281687 RepID=A0A8R1IQ41_CAEJA